MDRATYTQEALSAWTIPLFLCTHHYEVRSIPVTDPVYAFARLLTANGIEYSDNWLINHLSDRRLEPYWEGLHAALRYMKVAVHLVPWRDDWDHLWVRERCPINLFWAPSGPMTDSQLPAAKGARLINGMDANDAGLTQLFNHVATCLDKPPEPKGIEEAMLTLFAALPTLLSEVHPLEFERVIGRILSARGYEVSTTNRSYDGGVDLIASQPQAENYTELVVQCKRYSPGRRVGVREVRELHGVLTQRANTTGAILVTTSAFTSEARRFASVVDKRLKLIDSTDLHSWLIEGAQALTKLPQSS